MDDHGASVPSSGGRKERLRRGGREEVDKEMEKVGAEEGVGQEQEETGKAFVLGFRVPPLHLPCQQPCWVSAHQLSLGPGDLRGIPLPTQVVREETGLSPTGTVHGLLESRC